MLDLFCVFFFFSSRRRHTRCSRDWSSDVCSSDLTRYRLSTDELRGRVEAALGELENSQIGTIHSFAAHLLRLYPLEAGVDPRFTPDEEFVFDDFFTREWRGGGGGGAPRRRGRPAGRGKGGRAPAPPPPA